ncbi:MAG: glycosyl transferase family 1 [Bacillota bacterium]|nr:MAG: glycosyl transferase family 1 [Bacillota bacterium]
MKILWITNVILPQISELSGEPKCPFAGWLVDLFSRLTEDGHQMFSLFPYERELHGAGKNVKYRSFHERNCEKQIENVILEEHPDMIHIWGTEYKHGRNAVHIAEKLNCIDHVVINIQGLISECANYYTTHLPARVVRRFTLRDFLKRDNIRINARRYVRRGKEEIKALRKVKQVIGRTDWDQACMYAINPAAKYYFCNATLRNVFYKRKWSLEHCERHSVFVSQSNYPIKGVHFLLEAVAILKKEYPDIKIYTTGRSAIGLSFKERLLQTSYGKYLTELIKKYSLEKNIRFLGTLDEEEMCEQYLNTHVFVSSSSIENESNALGEAMLLGVPSVASYVGGVTNEIEHKKEGLLYPYDEPKVLAYYIKKIFDDDALALRFSESARKRAAETYDAENNYQTLISIYRNVCALQ